MSILMLIILVIYMMLKVDVLISKNQVDIISAINEDHFDENLSFSSSQGLNFAFGDCDLFFVPCFAITITIK